MKTEKNRELVMQPREALQKFFGFEDFLDGQEDVIAKIVRGEDGLVVMPTGGGKSLCYQLPALCFSGVTLVISPLIALMKDQVDALLARGIAATLINSTQTWDEQKEKLREIREGKWKLVYVAPERFRAESFLNAINDVQVELFAVDESHCLSQWGHDFRPDYMRLGKALEKIGHPQCIALTATATPIVREDILQVLKLRNPFEVVSGFARPNLSLNITPCESAAVKEERMKAVISAHRTGIVYCATRKKVESVSETLASWGLSCVAYHGGMTDEQRAKAQDVFISKKVDVAVATNAFGMGIDRSDVRFVLHYEIPGSVEAYYQEAGRAGRDGESAYCELLFNYADRRTQEFFIDGANPSVEVIRDIYQFLLDEADGNHEVYKTIEDIADGADLKNSMCVSSALALLGRAKYVERFDVPGKRMRGTRLLKFQTSAFQLELDEKAIEEKELRDREKLNAMVKICQSPACRQQWILDYFGEQEADTCGSCDVCRNGGGEVREATEEESLVVRKALSGVARMSRKTQEGWQAKYGKGKIVLMLTGSKAQEILSANLHKLSTYGMLKSYGTGYVSNLIRALEDGGYLVTEIGEYPTITMTNKGEMVMMGEAKCRMIFPKEKSKEEITVPSLIDYGFDKTLYDKLNKLRVKLAKERDIPIYMVFSNKTLEALTRFRPVTNEQALQVPGIGEMKVKTFLPPFLNILGSYRGR